MGAKVILTPDQESRLKELYGTTRNEELARALGLSVRTMQRFALDVFGLKKTCNLTPQKYRPKMPGFKIPGREPYLFKKGVSNEQRYGRERWKEIKARSGRSLSNTYKMERMRKAAGLPLQTKLRIGAQPRRVIAMRHALRKAGYIVERGSMMAYYTPATQRIQRYESGLTKNPFYFKPLPPEEGSV